MAVLNLTPDSFYDGGKLLAPGADRPNVSVVVRRARELLRQGAELLDLGGESTRPGAAPTDPDREQARVLPVLEVLARELPNVPLSIDTRHADVARAAVAAGVSIVNDISGLSDPHMLDVLAASRVGIVIGHLRGQPSSMQDTISFRDVVNEVCEELSSTVDRAARGGIDRARIVVDPGIGFGKTANQSSALIGSGAQLEAATGCPVLIGASRKSFLGQITGRTLNDRLVASVAAAVVAVERGAKILRVHDVQATVDALQVVDAVNASAGRSDAKPSAEAKIP
jgi:dihydropteroate synthase